MIDKNKVDNLKQIITKVSEENYLNKLTYSISFWFLCEVSVKIGDIEINTSKYGTDFGWGSWGKSITEEDLIYLEKEGFLIKISETIDEQDPLEKSIEYEIIKAV
jgi:hypothetical protein